MGAAQAGAGCGFCADMHLEANEFSFLIAELDWSYVRLARNQYRGWTLVALKRHACELFELDDIELTGFWRETAAVARAVSNVFQPTKMNYAIYCNLQPHIHCHLVPQFYSDDPTLPVNMQAKDVRLEEQEYRRIVAAVRQELRHEQSGASR